MDPASLKTFFDGEYVSWLADTLQQAEQSFDPAGFAQLACDGLDELELKARTVQIAHAMGQALSDDFTHAAQVVQRAMGDPGPPPEDEGMGGVRFWPHVSFLSAFGLSEPEAALRAMRRFTQHFSCEFAIRDFLIHHPELTMQHVLEWSRDPDWRVRRLASEGTRPRLPWGQKLKAFVADPEPVLNLLDAMHDDPQLIVRRSVANNLNDIAKDHPDRAVKVAERWFSTGHAGSKWTVKHGLRTLIKQGHPGALAVLGFSGGDGVEVAVLSLNPAAPKIGDSVELTLRMQNGETAPVNLVVDYALQRTLANGKKGEKVFKLRTLTLNPSETAEITTRLHFKQLSTRTYYPGEHAVRVLINGRVAVELEFDLL